MKKSSQKDILYAIRLVMKYGEKNIIGYCLTTILAGVLQFLFEVYYLAFLLSAIIHGASWNTTLQICLAGAGIVALRILLSKISERCQLFLELEIIPKIKRNIYEASLHQDIEKQLNKENYDEYTFVVQNCGQYIALSVNILCNAVIACIYVGFFCVELVRQDIYVMALIVLMLAFHFAMNYFLHKRLSDRKFASEQKLQPSIRKNDYYRRLFYLKSNAYYLRDEENYSHVMDLYDQDVKVYADHLVKCRKEFFAWNLFKNLYDNLYLYMIAMIALILMLRYRGILDISVYWQDYALVTKLSSLYFFSMVGDVNAVKKYVSAMRKFLEKIVPEKTAARLYDAPEIAIRNLSYQYENGGFSIDNLSLFVRKKEKIAIVGRNGSGKTTLLNLLLGLYQPASGEISIDGKDVSKYFCHGQHCAISLMSQNYNIYKLSIKDNVVMGQEEDSGRISEALDKAQCGDFVDALTEGAETKLGRDLYENATELSGGQEQRLALSRVFYDDSSLILMDEPTAKIDPLLEERIFSRSMDDFRDKTVMMITHQLGITKLFDRIIVMDNGKIVEEGPFDELMGRESVFRDMYNYQMGDA